MPEQSEKTNAVKIIYYGDFIEDDVPQRVCRILRGRGYRPDLISTNHYNISEIGLNEAYYYFSSPGVMPPGSTLENILRDVNLFDFKIINDNVVTYEASWKTRI